MPNRLPNTDIPHSSRNVFEQQSQHATAQQPLRGVGQDKVAPQRDRAAMTQPASPKNIARPHLMKINTPRSRKHSNKRKTVPMTLWVNPQLKAEIQRIAKQEGLSVSQTGGAALEEWVRQQLHIQHAVLIQPIIEATINKAMKALINNQSSFLGRLVFDSGQLRWLFINKLYQEVVFPQKKLTKDEFYNLLATSTKETLKNVRSFPPQIAEVVEGIKKQLASSEKE